MSRRWSWNIMNISAVHGPMPRTWTNLASRSSSDSDSTSWSGTVPSTIFWARSVTAAAFVPPGAWPSECLRASRERAAETCCSGELGHELRELVARQAKLVLVQVPQRSVGDVLRGCEDVGLRVDVQETGDQVAQIG